MHAADLCRRRRGRQACAPPAARGDSRGRKAASPIKSLSPMSKKFPPIPARDLGKRRRMRVKATKCSFSPRGLAMRGTSHVAGARSENEKIQAGFEQVLRRRIFNIDLYGRLFIPRECRLKASDR